ncbi:Cancer-associated gene 1 protein [Galemys pyrenaicus]|uniref:Cancer-associated gene 1 protein n=1 Tax=Galemys pyrenaicus TaxID=202257 RepID=A0A8J6A5B9_GALPY|nr:Cancer-associated gene 1 protein [Galemys pyrenaicus]
MNVSNLPQDFTHSNSPLYVEASSSTSDIPQVCIVYILQDVHIGLCTQTQPADPSFPACRLFEPPCEFYQTETFSGEVTTLQNLPEDSPFGEKAAVQSHTYKYAKVSNTEADSFEENLMGTSTCTNNPLAQEWAGQPLGSPPLTHCRGWTRRFLETPPLPRSPASAAALRPGPPQNFSCKESVHRVQNSGEIPELSMVHPQEVPEEGVEGPQVVPAGTWSPAGLSCSGRVAQDDCRSPDTEQSLESVQPLEEDMALNEVLQKLRQTNQKQQTRICNLQRSNRYLEKKVAELQRRTTKQQVFLDIINKLKENVEELIEDKYRVMLEKNDTEKTLQSVHKVLAGTQRHLQECRHEKEALQLELKKVKTSYVHLQERYVTEMQQKNETLSQCVERDETLSRKEEEVQRLQQLKGELEKATACALDLLRREKETREQEILSLQEEFLKQEKENLAERQKLKSRLEKLIAQVKNLQIVSENEKVKNTELQEQIDRVRRENARLQQQVTGTETQPCSPPPLPAPSREPSWDIPEPVPASPITQVLRLLTPISGSFVFLGTRLNLRPKDAKTLCPHLPLGCSRQPSEASPDAPDMKRAAELASKIHSLLALLVGFLITEPHMPAQSRRDRRQRETGERGAQMQPSRPTPTFLKGPGSHLLCAGPIQMRPAAVQLGVETHLQTHILRGGGGLLGQCTPARCQLPSGLAGKLSFHLSIRGARLADFWGGRSHLGRCSALLTCGLLLPCLSPRRQGVSRILPVDPSSSTRAPLHPPQPARTQASGTNCSPQDEPQQALSAVLCPDLSQRPSLPVPALHGRALQPSHHPVFDYGTASPDAEHAKDSEKDSDIMLQKLKSFHSKKKNLDKEESQAVHVRPHGIARRSAELAAHRAGDVRPQSSWALGEQHSQSWAIRNTISELRWGRLASSEAAATGLRQGPPPRVLLPGLEMAARGSQMLLKHKDRITTFRELIANEKAFQDQVIEATNFDSGEASSASDVPVLLGAKLDKYHDLNEELDFLIAKLGNLLESKENHCNRLIAENDKCQKHLGDLINKVQALQLR